ncbi:MAG: hybrid sensor histidine kinase/response regulator [Prochlorotrichaceae cyanobacterium]
MKHILVVEDEYFIRQNLQQILEFSNYQVSLAEDGEQALSIALREKPDIILSDVKMPNMDGYQFLEALRANTSTQLIPVVFLTARTEREDQRQAMAMGADDYISKPFTPEELLGALEARLKKSAVSGQQQQEKIDEFCAQLSRTLPHELNTPLNGISSSIDFLISRYSYFTRDEVLELLKVVQSSSQRLHRLIQNFLLYAELELKSHRTETPSLPVWGAGTSLTVIQPTLEAIAEDYQRPQDCFLELPPIEVPVPPSQLRKIFLELTDNAFKFSKAGTPVTVTGMVIDQQVTIKLQDQGRGMTSEQLKQIGAYTQFERKIYEQQGCGLGLTIAQRMVELFKGQLYISSQPQVGTLITVQFPSLTEPDH